MPARIETIPEKTRWEIATKGLTGVYIAISNALKQAVGQNKFEEFNGALWYGAGKGVKEFADGIPNFFNEVARTPCWPNSKRCNAAGV